MRKLQDMQNILKCKIFIMPVFPALEGFRTAVNAYNKSLEKAVKKMHNKNIIMLLTNPGEIILENEEMKNEYELNYSYITPKWMKHVDYFELISQEIKADE